MRVVALQHVASASFGISRTPNTLRSLMQPLRLGERRRLVDHLQRLVGVERLHDLARDLRIVLVDDGDRDLPHQLAEIRLRIERAVDHRREHDEAEGARRLENARSSPPRRPRRGARSAAARSRIRRRARGGDLQERRQPPKRERRIKHRKAREPGEGDAESAAGTPRAAWSNRICRYQRSGSSEPQALAKPLMPMTGKPTPAKPKAGEQMMPVERQAGREALGQRLEQRAERQIACDHQHRRSRGLHGVATKLQDGTPDAISPTPTTNWARNSAR